MPQGLSAYRPTAYPARPEASTRATGHVPQRPQARAQENARTSAAFSASPVRRRPSPQQHPNNRWQQNQDRRAASATTNAPAASSRTVPRLPKLATLCKPTTRTPAPQARRIRLGACYVSDEAELTIAAIAGNIQDRA